MFLPWVSSLIMEEMISTFTCRELQKKRLTKQKKNSYSQDIKFLYLIVIWFILKFYFMIISVANFSN